ncbi:hypothetical protein [Flavobacterium nitrogenifigens]|uniref:LURP-one-related n=1 Tax=Flavobacterium nitrogenifigens TaxID=1617283 RepID=A0A521BQE0_9FLAO|nr:hypothetical protein [Flavobacterium nitrogenifigens]KAF2330754.1 hypothetical protein DM397_13230 [Flavobacterium nitrogenifigens]SMO49378.1 hypothetical protein SAMN06265220_1011243 [Flavobacterium nitrogenifigens]
MEIEILQDKKRSLYVYKNNELLFYSKVKSNWTNRVTEIYNHDDILLLEVKYKMTLIKSSYKILFQNELVKEEIVEITDTRIVFDTDKRLYTKQDYFIAIDGNFSYYFKETRISQLKQKSWVSNPKIFLSINDENLEFLNLVLFHILATEAGYSSD